MKGRGEESGPAGLGESVGTRCPHPPSPSPRARLPGFCATRDDASLCRLTTVDPHFLEGKANIAVETWKHEWREVMSWVAVWR